MMGNHAQHRTMNGLIFLALCYLLAALAGVLFVLWVAPMVIHYHNLSTDHGGAL